MFSRGGLEIAALIGRAHREQVRRHVVGIAERSLRCRLAHEPVAEVVGVIRGTARVDHTSSAASRRISISTLPCDH